MSVSDFQFAKAVLSRKLSVSLSYDRNSINSPWLYNKSSGRERGVSVSLRLVMIFKKMKYFICKENLRENENFTSVRQESFSVCHHLAITATTISHNCPCRY